MEARGLEGRCWVAFLCGLAWPTAVRPLPPVLVVLPWTQHPCDFPRRERDWREDRPPIQPPLPLRRWSSSQEGAGTAG